MDWKSRRRSENVSDYVEPSLLQQIKNLIAGQQYTGPFADSRTPGQAFQDFVRAGNSFNAPLATQIVPAGMLPSAPKNVPGPYPDAYKWSVPTNVDKYAPQLANVGTKASKNLALTPAQVIAGEMPGRLQGATQEERMAEALMIASVIVNRAIGTNQTLENIVSGKKPDGRYEFSAYNTNIANRAENLELAQMALDEILANGPTTKATHYVTPAADDWHQRQLTPVENASRWHNVYVSPAGRSIYGPDGKTVPMDVALIDAQFAPTADNPVATRVAPDVVALAGNQPTAPAKPSGARKMVGSPELPSVADRILVDQENKALAAQEEKSSRDAIAAQQKAAADALAPHSVQTVKLDAAGNQIAPGYEGATSVVGKQPSVAFPQDDRPYDFNGIQRGPARTLDVERNRQVERYGLPPLPDMSTINPELARAIQQSVSQYASRPNQQATAAYDDAMAGSGMPPAPTPQIQMDVLAPLEQRYAQAQQIAARNDLQKGARGPQAPAPYNPGPPSAQPGSLATGGGGGVNDWRLAEEVIRNWGDHPNSAGYKPTQQITAIPSNTDDAYYNQQVSVGPGRGFASPPRGGVTNPWSNPVEAVPALPTVPAASTRSVQPSSPAPTPLSTAPPPYTPGAKAPSYSYADYYPAAAAVPPAPPPSNQPSKWSNIADQRLAEAQRPNYGPASNQYAPPGFVLGGIAKPSPAKVSPPAPADYDAANKAYFEKSAQALPKSMTEEEWNIATMTDPTLNKALGWELQPRAGKQPPVDRPPPAPPAAPTIAAIEKAISGGPAMASIPSAAQIAASLAQQTAQGYMVAPGGNMIDAQGFTYGGPGFGTPTPGGPGWGFTGAGPSWGNGWNDYSGYGYSLF